MMPEGFRANFQASFLKIYQSLLQRLTSHQWPPWISRQRAGHWLNRLKRHCLAHFGFTPSGLDLKSKISELFEKGINFLVS